MTEEHRILYAEFTATEGNEDRVAELVRELARRVRAEPGNLVFSATRKTDAPAEFFVYEEYLDAAGFEAHITADYGIAFNRELAPLIFGDGSELTWLEAL